VILGMTGTRHNITPMQSEWLHKQLARATELHHGACVGADAAAHQIARDGGLRIVVHPPVDERLMMPRDEFGTWLPAKPYLDRNRDIVDAVDEMIALPDGPERSHGGTWYTVRYARGRGKVLRICQPDGAVTVHGVVRPATAL